MTHFEQFKNLSVEEMANCLFEHLSDFDPCKNGCMGCRYFRRCRQGDSFDWINNEIKKNIQNWLNSEAEE